MRREGATGPSWPKAEASLWARAAPAREQHLHRGSTGALQPWRAQEHQAPLCTHTHALAHPRACTHPCQAPGVWWCRSERGARAADFSSALVLIESPPLVANKKRLEEAPRSISSLTSRHRGAVSCCLDSPGLPGRKWQEPSCVCGGLAAIPKRGAVTKPRYKQENNYQKFGGLGGRRREPVWRGKNAEIV